MHSLILNVMKSFILTLRFHFIQNREKILHVTTYMCNCNKFDLIILNHNK
jgi:hypothetical protein